MIVVRRATAAAYEFSKTAVAIFACKQTRTCEFFPYDGVDYAVVYVAHKKIFIARKLVTGIKVAVGHDGKIFVSRAACGNAFGQTGPAL